MPFFVFGTGRCGSTHLQRLISLNTDTWIWGEHDRFLAPILHSLSLIDRSGPLKAMLDAYGDEPGRIVAQMRDGLHDLAWLNAFDGVAFRRDVAAAIDRLFAEHLPDRWNDWGFKEILYGLDDDAPAELLALFPEARAAFTFREPRDNLQSMIRTWHPDLACDEECADELVAVADGYVDRWRRLLRYFLDLKTREPRRLKFVTLQSFSAPAQLLAALGFDEIAAADCVDPPATNAGSTRLSEDALALVSDRCAAAGAELDELFVYARAQAEDDLAL